MCGINGFTLQDERLIARMNEVTRHRGPDESRAVVLSRISLGNNRLAIIDLSARASQPMWDSDHELVIVFNGEVYNFLELRRTLETKYHFQSNSDTEVVLYAYKEYGADCLNKLNGIFGFAIWNERTGELFLARDRMGVNPLYYYEDKQRLIFSSEIKAILEHSVPRAVDAEAFSLYFQVLYVPEPLTMFQGIKKLPAASYATWRAGRPLIIQRYWQVADFSNLENRSEAVEQIRHLFPRVVKEQLISDRRVGIFLSGGIDSTAVLGAAAVASSGVIKTFSVGFKDSLDPAKFNADFSLARQTANHYQTDHTELMIGPDDIKDNLERIAWHLDEPNSNPTAGAMWLLSREAKKQVAVVLGGDGGDELFGGYPRYLYSRYLTQYQQLPGFVRALVEKALRVAGKDIWLDRVGAGPGGRRIALFLAQKQGESERILAAGRYQSQAGVDYFNKRFFSDPTYTGRPDYAIDFEKYFMQVDRQSWLVDESLSRTNKMCLGVGLEPRVPVLDYRMVELSARLPTAWKFGLLRNSGRQFKGKAIWKEAIAQYLPDHILHEQKRGWFTPMSKWMRGGLKSTVQEVLAPSNLSSEFFNPDGVERMLAEHVDSRGYHLSTLWALVMWQLWYRTFIKK